MVVNSRKVEHRSTFHGMVAASSNSGFRRGGSAEKKNQRRASIASTSSSSVTNTRRPSSAAPMLNSPNTRRPSSAAPSISSPSTTKPPSPSSKQVPSAARKIFSRDSLSVNTASRSSDDDPYQGSPTDPQWAPSLSPLPATPLPGDVASIPRKANSLNLSQERRNLAREGLSEEEEEGYVNNKVTTTAARELRLDSSPQISARTGSGLKEDEDEILFSLEQEAGLSANSSPNTNPPILNHRGDNNDDEEEEEEKKRGGGGNKVKEEEGIRERKKNNAPYKNVPTKHLPKYKALYNFVPYEDRHLAIEKGDVLYAIPDLDGEPLTEPGWTYCMLDENIELRGYVPDTFILFLAPNLEELKNKYHIALVQPPKERIYDVPDNQLFKINTHKVR
jgi:hypothetical protein